MAWQCYCACCAALLGCCCVLGTRQRTNDAAAVHGEAVADGGGVALDERVVGLVRWLGIGDEAGSETHSDAVDQEATVARR